MLLFKVLFFQQPLNKNQIMYYHINFDADFLKFVMEVMWNLNLFIFGKR